MIAISKRKVRIGRSIDEHSWKPVGLDQGRGETGEIRAAV
jgi:hypothetical protein